MLRGKGRKSLGPSPMPPGPGQSPEQAILNGSGLTREKNKFEAKGI